MSWDLGAGLDGRVAIVTGGLGGIGREVASALATAGAAVACVDARDGLDEVVAGLPGPGPHRAHRCDLADLAAQRELLARVHATFGRLDVLVHTAAVIRRRHDISEVTEEDWDAQHDVNLRATFFLARAAADVMRAGGAGGRIVLFTSQSWQTGGFGGSVVYAATKGGVVSLTRGLARTYAAEGITVNAIAPGAVDTAMLRDDLDEAQLDAFVARIPLGRVATPAEVAGTAVFLASQHAGYITGATVDVTGGMLMH
ncbi:MAG: SDR family oxidoreductase [Thermoleophilia bacterium]